MVGYGSISLDGPAAAVIRAPRGTADRLALRGDGVTHGAGARLRQRLAGARACEINPVAHVDRPTASNVVEAPRR